MTPLEGTLGRSSNATHEYWAMLALPLAPRRRDVFRRGGAGRRQVAGRSAARPAVHRPLTASAFPERTSAPRVLVTYVRYPTRGHRPFPLVVFAHGFAR